MITGGSKNFVDGLSSSIYSAVSSTTTNENVQLFGGYRVKSESEKIVSLGGNDKQVSSSDTTEVKTFVNAQEQV